VKATIRNQKEIERLIKKKRLLGIKRGAIKPKDLREVFQAYPDSPILFPKIIRNILRELPRL
jgi:hypothetical protein